MKAVAIVALTVLVGLLLLAVVGCMTVMSVNNDCVAYEESIKAQYEQNKNNYDNYFKKVREAAQIPEMYIEDMREIYNEVMAGRYGPDGSRALMQWIQEQNPQLDATLYRQIQQMIEAGRNSFQEEQRSLIDKKRAYQQYLRSWPTSWVAGWLNYPKINFDDYNIVTSDETEDAFDDGRSDPIDVRPDDR